MEEFKMTHDTHLTLPHNPPVSSAMISVSPSKRRFNKSWADANLPLATLQPHEVLPVHHAWERQPKSPFAAGQRFRKVWRKYGLREPVGKENLPATPEKPVKKLRVVGDDLKDQEIGFESLPSPLKRAIHGNVNTLELDKTEDDRRVKRKRAEEDDESVSDGNVSSADGEMPSPHREVPLSIEKVEMSIPEKATHEEVVYMEEVVQDNSKNKGDLLQSQDTSQEHSRMQMEESVQVTLNEAVCQQGADTVSETAVVIEQRPEDQVKDAHSGTVSAETIVSLQEPDSIYSSQHGAKTTQKVGVEEMAPHHNFSRVAEPLPAARVESDSATTTTVSKSENDDNGVAKTATTMIDTYLTSKPILEGNVDAAESADTNYEDCKTEEQDDASESSDVPSEEDADEITEAIQFNLRDDTLSLSHYAERDLDDEQLAQEEDDEADTVESDGVSERQVAHAASQSHVVLDDAMFDLSDCVSARKLEALHTIPNDTVNVLDMSRSKDANSSISMDCSLPTEEAGVLLFGDQETQQSKTASRSTVSTSCYAHFEEDTATLHAYLERQSLARASKATRTRTRPPSIAKRESLSHRRDSDAVRQALSSPYKAVLSEKDLDSPSTRFSQTSTPTPDGETTAPSTAQDVPRVASVDAVFPAPSLTAPNADEDKDDDTPLLSPRRSARHRRQAQNQVQLPKLLASPAKRGASPIKPARSTLHVDAPVSLAAAEPESEETTVGVRDVALPAASENRPVSRTDAQQLAIITRSNTRRNKGGSLPPPKRLVKLRVEEQLIDHDNGADGRTTEQESFANDEWEDRPGSKVKWHRELVAYQEAPSEDIDEGELRVPRTRIRRLRPLNGTPAKPTLGAGLLQQPEEDAAGPSEKVVRKIATPAKRLRIESFSKNPAAGLASDGVRGGSDQAVKFSVKARALPEGEISLVEVPDGSKQKPNGQSKLPQPGRASGIPRSNSSSTATPKKMLSRSSRRKAT